MDEMVTVMRDGFTEEACEECRDDGRVALALCRGWEMCDGSVTLGRRVECERVAKRCAVLPLREGLGWWDGRGWVRET
jgi:hypothetical protein